VLSFQTKIPKPNERGASVDIHGISFLRYFPIFLELSLFWEAFTDSLTSFRSFIWVSLVLILHPSPNKSILRIHVSQTFLRLTNFIERSNNIYDIK
jgi:hypothetical protein